MAVLSWWSDLSSSEVVTQISILTDIAYLCKIMELTADKLNIFPAQLNTAICL